MGLIASSSSSLGDEMFELLGTDLELVSSVGLEKGKRKKERKKERKKGAITCDIIRVADSAVCGHSIKSYQADEQMITNQMGSERCLSGKVWQLTEIASWIINF